MGFIKDMTIPLKPFYMIRHGESEANLKYVVSGQIDVALTENGIKQAQNASHIFKTLDAKPQIIFHSHLSRAKDTARIINEVLDLNMIEIKDVAEQHYGDWEHASWTDIKPFIETKQDPPNGETHADFKTRVARGISSALNQDKSPPLIVCHGGVFHAFSALFGFHLKHVANCTLYEFTPAPEQDIPWKINYFSEEGARQIAL